MTNQTKNNGGSNISIGNISNVNNAIFGDHNIMTVHNSPDSKLRAKIDALTAKLDDHQRAFVEKVDNIVHTQAVGIDEHSQQLEALSQQLDKLVQAENLPTELAYQIEQIYATVQPATEAAGVDIRHRLKLTWPIIPFFLAYESELELNARQELGAVKALVQKL